MKNYDNIQQKHLYQAEKIVLKEFNYTFKNKNILLEAITHSSFYFENINKTTNFNERLEFLGDSVLGLSVSKYLFQKYPDKDEGYLTSQRALVVCEPTLADFAKSINWQTCLILGKGEKLGQGELNPNNLANAIEALFGALFLETDFETVSTWIISLLGKYLLKAEAGTLVYDYKSKLYEYIHVYLNEKKITKYKATDLHFSLLERSGPDHDPLFVTGVYLATDLLASASGKTKKIAEQRASEKALKILLGEK